jgi:hypothetical protein
MENKEEDLKVWSLDEVLKHVSETDWRLNDSKDMDRAQGAVGYWVQKLEASKMGEIASGFAITDSRYNPKDVAAYLFFSKKEYRPAGFENDYAKFADWCIDALKQLTQPDDNFDPQKAKVFKGFVAKLT